MSRGRPRRAAPTTPKPTETPPNRAFPRWIVAAALIGGALLTYIAQRGGPANAWQEFREAAGYYHSPKIVGLAPIASGSTRFTVSIENPNLQRLLITEYEATASVSSASTPAAPAPSLSWKQMKAIRRNAKIPTGSCCQPRS